MASTISTVGFDAAFPVAGVDNDSQGFRTNFNVTKVGLEQAATEITSLQSTTAKLNAANDFNGSIISEAELQKNTETVYSNAARSGAWSLDWEQGHYQTLQANGTLTATITNLPPSGVMGRMRLQLTGDGTSRVVTLASATGSILTDGHAAWTGDTLSVNSATTPVIIDLWSINGGTTIFANYVGIFA
jgi:hypothetical protein